MDDVSETCAALTEDGRDIVLQVAAAICPGVTSTQGLDHVTAAAKLTATLGVDQAAPFVNRAAAVAIRSVKDVWPDWSQELADGGWIEAGRITAPKTVAEAKARPDWPRWEN